MTNFNVCTNIIPDDDSRIGYRWHGGQYVAAFSISDQSELEGFTMGEDGPTLADVLAAVESHHAAHTYCAGCDTFGDLFNCQNYSVNR